ncbi:hypothetical protein QR685DRAFT_437363 [Neurospora intermedia]|uniref:Uncharacterized protein n=1 Tax=Neurospora intermedia TaxID=5142 RepID=A0ABR3DJJ0_NEUIN
MASDCRLVDPNGSKVSTLPPSPPHPNLGSSESCRERQHQPSAIHNVFVVILTHHGERPRMAMTHPNPSVAAVIASEPVASPPGILDHTSRAHEAFYP